MMKSSNNDWSLQLIELPEILWFWFAKAAGAVLGSVISVAYVLPRGRREAAIRFLVGLAFGIVFGALAGAKLIAWLGMEGELTRFETVLVGSAAASLCAWGALGILHRWLERYPILPKAK